MPLKNTSNALGFPARRSWSNIRSKWPDSLVLSGLVISAIGIGYGHTRVIAGGLSVTLGAAWVSMQRQQQATVRDVNLLKASLPSIEQSQQRLLEQLQEQIPRNLLPAVDARVQDSVSDQINRFTGHFENISEALQAIQANQNAIAQKLLPTPCEEEVSEIIQICQNFHDLVANAPDNRQPINIEEDIQKKLEEILRRRFPNFDIRPEYVVPASTVSEKGCSSFYRIDLLLADHQCAIEVKYASNQSRRSIVEQLAIDIEVYRHSRHPFHTLICFIYDPERRLTNPQGLMNDLSGDRGGFQLKTVISPPPNPTSG